VLWGRGQAVQVSGLSRLLSVVCSQSSLVSGVALETQHPTPDT